MFKGGEVKEKKDVRNEEIKGQIGVECMNGGGD